MKDFNLKLIVEAIDRVTAPARKMGQAIGTIGKATGLDKLGSAAGDVGKGLLTSGKEAVKFGGWMVGAAAAAGGAIAALVNKTAGTSEGLLKMSGLLGIGVEQLQRYHFAAGAANVSTELFDQSMLGFSKRAADAAAGMGPAGDAFAALGIRLKDSHGKMRPTEALLGDVADRMTKIQDPAKRARLAMLLFGDQGVDMVNMLKDGSKGLREATAEADKFGIQTEAQVKAGSAFKDNLQQLTTLISQLGYVVGNELMPFFNEFVVNLRDLAVEARPQIIAAIKQAFTDLGAAVTFVKETWAGLTGGLTNFQQILVLTVPLLAPLVQQIIALFEGMGVTRGAVALLATALGVKFGIAVFSLFGPLAKLAWGLGVVAVKMTLLAATGVRALISGIITILPMLGSAIAATWAWTAALLANPLTWVVVGVLAAVAAIAGAAYLLYRNWDEVAAFFTGLWDGIAATFSDALTSIEQLFAGIDLSEIGRRWIGSLADGLMERWHQLTEWLSGAVGSVGGLVSTVFGLGGDRGQRAGGGTIAAPVASAIQPQEATKVGGSIRVEFDNAPSNMRIREVRSDSADVTTDVFAGYAMAGAGS